MKQQWNVETTLVPGSGGVFDVVVDGTEVFSKHKVGRHAAPGECVQLIKSHLGAAP
ncbi:MAG: hypothetical protein HY904_05200 [Deltaproteobacteria bacterium]|nr:hypothetical protein [Deltaproteobacteria bacterium]